MEYNRTIKLIVCSS